MDFQANKAPKQDLQGDIARALRSDQRLDANDILRNAWQYTKTSRKPLTNGILLAFLVMFVAAMVVLIVGSAFELDAESDGFSVILAALNILIWSPLLAGINLIALRTVAERPHEEGAVFSFLSKPWAIIGTAFFTMIVTQLPLLFGVPLLLSALWALFFHISFALSIMLVAIGKVSAINGLYYSLLLVKKRFFAVFTIHLVLVILGVIGFLPAILVSAVTSSPIISMLATGAALYGLVAWLLPTYYHAIAICYRDLMFLEPPVVPESNDHNSYSDNDFTA